MRWTEGAPGRAISTATWSDGMPSHFGGSLTKTNAIYSIYANYNTKLDLEFGYQTVFPNVSTVANRRAQSVVVNEAGFLYSITLYHEPGYSQVILAVYDDAGGKPGTLLGTTGVMQTFNWEGWDLLHLQSPVAVAPGQTIWLAWVFENDPGMRWAPGMPTRVASRQTWPGGMPDDFGWCIVEGDVIYSIYATYAM
jgi:hypothetical protein